MLDVFSNADLSPLTTSALTASAVSGVVAATIRRVRKIATTLALLLLALSAAKYTGLI